MFTLNYISHSKAPFHVIGGPIWIQFWVNRLRRIKVKIVTKEMEFFIYIPIPIYGGGRALGPRGPTHWPVEGAAPSLKGLKMPLFQKMPFVQLKMPA